MRKGPVVRENMNIKGHTVGGPEGLEQRQCWGERMMR